MTRMNQILIGIFAVQILLTGGVYISNQPTAADSAQQALLIAEQSQIDRVTIDDGGGKKTVLIKVNGQWQLPEYHQLPADQNKVKQALTKLADTRSGWPVATTNGSHERFEVSEDNYQARITLARGDEELQTIFLGTSPGFRQLHVRKSDQDQVYSVKLNSHDYPVSSNSWFDRRVLRPGNNISSISGPDFTLNKDGAEWKTSEDDKQVIKEEADNLLTALNAINVTEVADKSIEKVDFTLKVKATNEEYEYHFLKEGEDHYVRRNDLAQTFKVSKFDFEKITGMTANKLVKVGESEKEKQNAGNTSGNKLNQSNS